jgi:phosphoadenosine phosphosulfate reductase
VTPRGGPSSRRAVTVGDLAYARTGGYLARLSRARAAIQEAMGHGRVGVSYSGGKDSTVTLALVREVLPDAPAAFYDSGCEYPGTYAMIAHYGARVITPEKSLVEMCKYGGYWGHPNPVDPDAEFDFFAFLVAEPSWRFICEEGLRVVALGLRGQESAGRRMNARQRGELYFIRHRSVWHLCPLAQWRDADVWAYLASQGLAYNPAYDKMAALGIPREHWRVGMLLGMAKPGLQERYAWLRQMEPALWNRLVADFPKIKEFT